tara:strand:- start:1812 stop:2297 length:486 start_codon:yes stop_codon:yes gene_type:complete
MEKRKPIILAVLSSISFFSSASDIYMTKYEFSAEAEVPSVCIIEDTSSNRTELNFGEQQNIPADAYSIKIVSNVPENVHYSIDKPQVSGLEAIDGRSYSINFRSNVDMMDRIDTNHKYTVDNFTNGQSELKFWAETELAQSYFKPTSHASVSTTITISCDN